jgi:serine-type D-Ala-D-Ala carboxypeptidase/endopeptidase (penicillin-binding protein 4)
MPLFPRCCFAIVPLLGLLSSCNNQAQKLQPIADPVGISQRIAEPWAVVQNSRDPEAEAIVQRYLKGLSELGLSPNEQGVWLQSGLFQLAQNQGQTPLSAASLTKIATSLAALEQWGPQHQFVTSIGATGQLQGGVLAGDLVIQGSGDPMLVWEEAIAIGNALNQLGVRQVTGDLIITGPFYMNFEWDPVKSGNLLKQALNSGAWSEATQAQYAKMQPLPAKPTVTIAGNVRFATTATPTTPLMQHRSLPLWNIVKRLNIYSNNFMSEALSRLMGGHAVVMQKASKAAGIDPAQLRLINGSGLGEENQISPQAASMMFAAIQRYASLHQLNVADLFPISGVDKGTIDDRDIPLGAVVKTGTLNAVSALAGVVPTRDRGLVSFAIINRGTNLDGLRSRQDVLLGQLQQAWGKPTERSEGLMPLAAMQAEPVTLGAVSRNVLPPVAKN